MTTTNMIPFDQSEDPGNLPMILPSTPRSVSPRRMSARRNVPRQWQLPSACIMRGYLAKKGGRLLRRKWFDNLFLIEDGTLFICWDLTSHFLIETAIPLTNILACNKHKKDQTQFTLIYNGVKNNKGAWQKCKVDVKCATEAEREAWVNQLLEMRETARCLNSDLVDRSKAYEALQSALDEVRRAAAQAIVSTIAGALKGSEYRGMDRAFHILRGPRNNTHRSSVVGSDSLELPRRPIPTKGRANFSGESLPVTGQPTPRGIPLEGFRAINHLEGMLKTIYWYRALKLKRLHQAFRKLNSRPPSPRPPPSPKGRPGGVGGSGSPSKRSARSYAATSSSKHPAGGNGGFTPPKPPPVLQGSVAPDLSGSGLNNSQVFVENLCIEHSEMMARDMVRYRTRRLVSVLEWIYKSHLQSSLTQLSICAKAHGFVIQEKAGLLIHLLKHRDLKELMNRKFIWNLLQAYRRKCERREKGLLQLLEPALLRRRRFAVRLWYMNCVKMADRDYAAILKLTGALKKTNLRILLAAFRRIDKHATEKASDEVMQVAQNLTQVNTKILASFHQIPVSRAVVQLCGVIRNFELNRKRIGLNELLTHACRYRTLVRLSSAVVATLRNIETRISVRDPFNALRAHASHRSVAIARAQLAAGLGEAALKVKSCGSRTLARCYRQSELKLLEFGMMRLRRFNLARQLGAEQEAFLTHYSAILTHGQRSAAEIFATKLAQWFETQRLLRLVKAWTALLDNWDKGRRIRATEKIQATTRLLGLIDRWRCVVLANAFQIFKYRMFDLPHENTLMIQSATNAIASAEKIAARIELSRKIEGASKDWTVSELITRQQDRRRRSKPESGACLPSVPPPQSVTMTQLRKELKLVSPHQAPTPLTWDDPFFTDFNNDFGHPYSGSRPKHDENKKKVEDTDVNSEGSVASLLRLADKFLASSDNLSSALSGEVLPPISSRSDGGRLLVSQAASKQLAAILADSGCDWSEISDVLGEFNSPVRRPASQRRKMVSEMDKCLLSTTSETMSAGLMSQDSDLSDLKNRKIAFVKCVTKTGRQSSQRFDEALSSVSINGSVSLGGPSYSATTLISPASRTIVLRARPSTTTTTALQKKAIVQY